MYNTSRGGGEGGEGSSGVNVKKWLADNKLSEVEKVFLEREIQIEELADFQAEELADFAKDLGLDTLQRRRFVKAIQDMRKARPPAYGESSGGGGMSTTGMPTSTSSTLTSTSGYGGEPSSGLTTTTGMSALSSSSSSVSSSNVHVMVSPQEHKAMNKLQQYFDKSGLVVQQLASSPATLKKSATECESEINEKLERIVAAIEDKRKQLLRQVDGLKQEKEMKLKEQLTTLMQYQQLIAQGKVEYETIMTNVQLDVPNRKKEIVRVAQGILNRKGVNLIVATQPKMQFTFEPAVLDKFLKDLDIDDCDQPFPPIVAVVKATYNTITVEWQMSHPSLVSKVDEFGIEVARVRKNEEKKKAKKSKKKGKGKKKKKGSDDDSASGSDDGSDDDGSDDDGSDDDGSDDDDDESSNKKSKKRKGGDKDKDKNTDDEKIAKDKESILDDEDVNLDNAEGDFTEEELAGVRWTEAEVIKSQKSKYRLENGGWTYDIRNLKDSTVYAIRIRGKNKSGWGAFSVSVKGITKKLTIDSNILKAKEKEALLKFVTKKERKKRWKLIFRASKDGFGCSQFHAKCDNKGTTVTIVQSTIGNVFGGYTTLPWQASGGAYQQDAKAFIFLLRSSNPNYKKAQKWTCKVGSNAVYHSSSYGPVFGSGFDFYLCSGCDSSNSSYSNAGNSYNCPTDQTLLAGSYNFTVKEYEVYQIK